MTSDLSSTATGNNFFNLGPSQISDYQFQHQKDEFGGFC